MRVRLDIHGRPKDSSSQPSPASASEDPSSPHPAPLAQPRKQEQNQQTPLLARPDEPLRPVPAACIDPSPSPVPSPPASSAASSADHAQRPSSREAVSRGKRTLPPRPPLRAVPPPLQVSSLQEDERASDSGSSAGTEAYNSEDEHPNPQKTSSADVPMRTLREREDEFASQLEAKSLRIVEMRPDGNCLFRALAYGIWNDPERHAALRANIMQYLVQERDYFSQFVAEDFVRYIRRKRRDGTHGNHLELQAAAELFGRPIEVYSYGDTPATIIESWGGVPSTSREPPEPVRLSFHRGSHYNAVRPVNEPQKSVKRARGRAADQADWCEAADARATQDEMERAVLALSLVEATRGDSAPGSASSAAAAVPTSALALIKSGYSEERAMEAYRIAGQGGSHGGLPEMIRYLTTDYFQPKIEGTEVTLGRVGVASSARENDSAQGSDLVHGDESKGAAASTSNEPISGQRDDSVE